MWVAAAASIKFSQTSAAFGAFKHNPCSSSLLIALHCTPTMNMNKKRGKTEGKQKDKSLIPLEKCDAQIWPFFFHWNAEKAF